MNWRSSYTDKIHTMVSLAGKWAYVKCQRFSIPGVMTEDGVTCTICAAEQFAEPDPADLAALQRDFDEWQYRLAAEEDANPQGGLAQSR